jgi:hypothetical protein
MRRSGDLWRRVRSGVGFGLFFATLLAAFVVVAQLLRGGAPNALGIPLAAIVGFYLAAGVVGGAVYGLMAPLRRTFLGRAFIAFVLLNLVYGSGMAAFTDALREGAGPFVLMPIFCAPFALLYAAMFRD